MKKNVGTLDAVMRITIGLFGLAWSISQMSHRPHRVMPKLIALMSSLKVAEGVTRFCPGLALIGASTRHEEGKTPKAPFSTVNYARRKMEDSPLSSAEERRESYE